MRVNRRQQAGFTLTEIIVVLGSIGVLAMLAVPAFTQYVYRSRTSEALVNLNMLFKGAASYFEQAKTDSQGVASGEAGRCVVGSTALAPAVPSKGKQQVDFMSVDEFKALNFTIADPVMYGYRIVSAGNSTCGASASTVLYTFMAMGDLDGDSVFSRFELPAGTNASNEFYHSAGIYIVNERE